MIEQKAQVIKQNDGAVWVEAERQSTCSGCQMKKGCGTGLMEKHVGQRFSKIKINTSVPVQSGQTVNVHIPEQALLSGAFLVYIFPLLALFLGAAFSRWLGFGELSQISVGLFALMLGFVYSSKKLSNKQLDINVELIEEKE